MTKIKSYKRLKNTIAAKKLSEFLHNHERFQGSYFWSPPSNASGRRRMEFDDSYSFIFNGNRIDLDQSISCSCRNVYFSSIVNVDGEKKDIRTVKRLLKSIQ